MRCHYLVKSSSKRSVLFKKQLFPIWLAVVYLSKNIAFPQMNAVVQLDNKLQVVGKSRPLGLQVPSNVAQVQGNVLPQVNDRITPRSLVVPFHCYFSTELCTEPISVVVNHLR